MLQIHLNLTKNEIEARITELHEQNPMLGHRGCRLGFLFQKFMKCNVAQYLKRL